MKCNYIKPQLLILNIGIDEMIATSLVVDPSKTTDTSYSKGIDLWEFEEEEIYD